MKRASPTRRTAEQAIEAVARNLLGKMFGAPCEMTIELGRDNTDAERLICFWKAGGWSGRLELQRPGARLLDGRDLRGLLKILQDAEASGDDP